MKESGSYGRPKNEGTVNERHLKRLLTDYVRYNHEDRTHLGLEGNTRRQDSFHSAGPSDFSRPARRIASPLRSGCLEFDPMAKNHVNKAQRFVWSLH
jgi:hypothetical protein